MSRASGTLIWRGRAYTTDPKSAATSIRSDLDPRLRVGEPTLDLRALGVTGTQVEPSRWTTPQLQNGWATCTAYVAGGSCAASAGIPFAVVSENTWGTLTRHDAE